MDNTEKYTINPDDIVCGVYTYKDILECIDDLSDDGKLVLIGFLENLLVGECSSKQAEQEISNL